MLAAPILLAGWCGMLFAQTAANPADASSAAQTSGKPAAEQPTDSDAKARKLLAQMVDALGGQKWLTLQSISLEGRVSGFFQGKPTGAITDFFSVRTPPTPAVQGQERVDLTKKRDVSTIFNPTAAWEITFRGKRPLPEEQAQDYFRRRDHSIETAVLVWLKDPATVLISEGQTVAERHLVDQVTLISASNDAITLQLDTETHLPLRRVFRWRDPVYKDKNEEVESYDDYHTIAGIATAFTVTRFHNDDMVSQRFLYRAAYNVPVPQGTFDADLAASKLKH